MLQLGIEDMLVLVGLWFTTSCIGALIFVRFVFLRYGGDAVFRVFENPNPRLKKSFFHLFDWVFEWANTPRIEVKKKVKTEAGEEIETVQKVTPMDVIFGKIVESAGEKLAHKMLGVAGGIKKKEIAAAQAALNDLKDSDDPEVQRMMNLLPSLVGKAEKDGDYAMLAVNKIFELFAKNKGQTGQSAPKTITGNAGGNAGYGR